MDSSEIEFRIDMASGIPIYRQIVNQVKNYIASGQVEAGTKMPSIRSISKKLNITNNTVIHAYSILEKNGLIVNRHGIGSFVANTSIEETDLKKIEIIRNIVKQLVIESKQLNMDDHFVDNLIKQERNDLNNHGIKLILKNII